ncbi:tyrosine-type recombinase/integrase [Acetobacter senegalensis]|nr:tyrosine-type recombinase/integrase [Acetobacter senegalensis]
MHGLRRTGGLTWYARLSIPRDRWIDAGKAYGKPSGILQERVVSLQTRDLKEAIRRRDKALAHLRAEVDAKLIAAGFAPLAGDWKPDWMEEDALLAEALAARKRIQAASDVGEDEEGYPDSPMHRLIDGMDDMLSERAAELDNKGLDGAAYLTRFREIATGTATPFGSFMNRWRREREQDVSASTLHMEGASLRHFGTYLAEKQGRGTPKDPMAFLEQQVIEDIPLPVIGEYSEWLFEKGLSPKTIGRQISSLKVLWDWCLRKHILSGANPWAGATAGLKKRAEKMGKTRGRVVAYTADELVLLLKADPDEGRRWAWGSAIHDLMRLALLTGARENELCSLSISRIVNRDGEWGPLWGITVLASEAKTDNSVRSVPLHPLVRPIIERRLAAAIATGKLDAPLFPECKPGGPGMKRGYYFAKRFTTFRRDVLGDASGRVVTFHSFRKCFGTFMRRASVAGVSECQLSVAQKLMGHKPQTITESVYMEQHMPWPSYEAAILGMVDKGMPEAVKDALPL